MEGPWLSLRNGIYPEARECHSSKLYIGPKPFGSMKGYSNLCHACSVSNGDFVPFGFLGLVVFAASLCDLLLHRFSPNRMLSLKAFPVDLPFHFNRVTLRESSGFKFMFFKYFLLVAIEELRVKI